MTSRFAPLRSASRALAMTLALTAAAATPADAAVDASASDGFLVKHVFEIGAKPEAAWRALLQPGRYWPKAHTWSGDPAHLTLDAHAGGCFCERWKQGEVEHARVLMVRPGSLLRMQGALGPLQDMALTGVLTINLAAHGEQGTTATITYRVSGDSQHRLESLAPIVEQVLGEQFGRFARYAATGKPDASAP